MSKKAQFSKELLDMISEFVICSIGSKVAYGINYVIFEKKEENKEICERYREIKKEVLSCGYEPDEIFRMTELCNGYIFEVDLALAKKVAYEVSKSTAIDTEGTVIFDEELNGMPSEYMGRNIARLAKKIEKVINNKENILSVALYSTDLNNTILINGVTKKGEPVYTKFNAYCLTQNAIKEVNKLIINIGYRVNSALACEVLPGATGVKYNLRIEEL